MNTQSERQSIIDAIWSADIHHDGCIAHEARQGLRICDCFEGEVTRTIVEVIKTVPSAASHEVGPITENADDLVTQLVAIDGPCDCEAKLCPHWQSEAGIILTAAGRVAPPSTSEAAIRAAAEEIADMVGFDVNVKDASGRTAAAILSRWFGKGETEQENKNA